MKNTDISPPYAADVIHCLQGLLEESGLASVSARS